MDFIEYDLCFIVQQAISEDGLEDLPLYSGVECLEDLSGVMHKSYAPYDSVANLMLNKRSETVLQTLKIETIGELLLTPYFMIMQQKNCGEMTLRLIQKTVRKYLLSEGEKDLTSTWKCLETMLRESVVLNERNFQILKARLGINLPQPMTLEECGTQFGTTREAARQTLRKIADIIKHPSSESNLRPFWRTVNKLIKKRDVLTSDDLAQKLKSEFKWSKKPESHAIERLLEMKKETYVVDHNLVGFSGNKCFRCNNAEKRLWEIVETRSTIAVSQLQFLYRTKFVSCCPSIKDKPVKVLDSLIPIHTKRFIKQNDKLLIRNSIVLNLDKYVPNKRRKK